MIYSIYSVTLSPRLNNLFVLWEEYKLGVGGRVASWHFLYPWRGHKKVKTHFSIGKKCGIQLLNSSNLIVLQTVPSTTFILSMVHHL
mmetsp:Transcript_15102/g.22474  ORF Transcript_15102/g.22474 Transcript_15102/m.22474 type:complete len:87 (+) Transcript_15102:1351-1611(+)